MRSVRSLTLSFAVLILMAGLCQAQSQRQRSVPAGTNSVLVTATTSDHQVRFSALTFASRIRLSIVSQTGELLYDSGFHPGNLLEWQVKDQKGSDLADGLYAVVVTVEDLSGQVSDRSGILQLQSGKALFQKTGQTDAASVSGSGEPETLTILGTDEPLPMTLVLHDDSGGLIESGQGRLDFHAGAFFNPKDNRIPHMRLTPEGNLGIGVAEPEAKLDVAGMIKTTGGVQFSDGTVLRMDNGSAILVNEKSSSLLRLGSLKGTSNAGSKSSGALVANGSTGIAYASAGTANKIAKFTNATDLGDSALTELNGKLGIGTATPQAPLDIQNTANTDTSIYLNSPGTQSGQQSSMNFITKAGTNLGNAGTQGWTMYARGNAWSSPDEQNDFGFSYWNGSNWIGALAMDSATGYVGIGTLAPKAKLDVTNSANTDASIYLNTPGTQSNQQSSMNFVTKSGGNLGGAGTQGWTMYARGNAWSSPAEQNDFGFSYWNGSSWVSSLAMDSATGNVGFGTTSPSSRVTVAGNVQVTGTGNGIMFPDGSSLTSSSAAKIRAITYLAGCDSCSVLDSTDNQKTIYVNLIGGMTVNSVTCFSDAGSPAINVQRDNGSAANILSSSLSCSPSGATSTSISQSTLNLNDQVHFVMVSADGVAKRLTVIIKATVN